MEVSMKTNSRTEKELKRIKKQERLNQALRENLKRRKAPGKKDGPAKEPS